MERLSAMWRVFTKAMEHLTDAKLFLFQFRVAPSQDHPLQDIGMVPSSAIIEKLN
jgi:hypothetical protein